MTLLNDIWNRIDFDLTKLISYDPVGAFIYSAYIFVTFCFILFILKYIPDPQPWIEKKTKAWYLRPFRWLYHIVGIFLFLFIITVPFIFFDL